MAGDPEESKMEQPLFAYGYWLQKQPCHPVAQDRLSTEAKQD